MPTTSRLAVRIAHDLADRILAGEIAPRHRFVDHDRAGRALAIARVDEAPLEQRHLHRLEIAGRRGADVGARLLAVGAAARLPSIVNGSAKSMPTGYIGSALTPAADCTPGSDADAVDRVHVEARAIEPGLVLRLRQIDLHREQVARLEARRHAHQLREAARHQAGADEQHQRQRDLDDDERAEQAPIPTCASCRRTRSSCRASRRATPESPARGRRRARPRPRRRARTAARRRRAAPPASAAGCLRAARARSGRRPTRRAARARRQSPESTKLSASTCRTSCTRPAPSAARTRDLAAPAREPRQDQVGDVRADDQQQESDRAPEIISSAGRTVVTSCSCAGNHARAPAGVAVRIGRRQPAGDDASSRAAPAPARRRPRDGRRR